MNRMTALGLTLLAVAMTAPATIHSQTHSPRRLRYPALTLRR